MRYGVTLLTLGIIALVPFSALAAQCSSQGFTVIFVNGVLNEVEKATANSRDLQDALGFSFGSEQLVVKVGHNQSHIAGLGDFAQSVGQIDRKSTRLNSSHSSISY